MFPQNAFHLRQHCNYVPQATIEFHRCLKIIFCYSSDGKATNVVVEFALTRVFLMQRKFQLSSNDRQKNICTEINSSSLFQVLTKKKQVCLETSVNRASLSIRDQTERTFLFHRFILNRE